MQYDPKIIEQFAEKLYAKAKSIIITYTVLGFLIGLGVGTFLLPIIGSAIGAVFLGLFGLALGNDKAFQLKLQAQTALCQIQIERNTGEAPPMPMFTRQS